MEFPATSSTGTGGYPRDAERATRRFVRDKGVTRVTRAEGGQMEMEWTWKFGKLFESLEIEEMYG